MSKSRILKGLQCPKLLYLTRYPPENFEIPSDPTLNADVFDRASEVFEDSGKAHRWLKKPCRALGGKVPETLLDSPRGIQTVLDELVRIEHGVYY